MENQASNLKKERQKKFLTVLPIIVIPFLTLIFWAMGGGKVEQAKAEASNKKGINNILPDANLKDDKGLDKMSYYDRASKDSVRIGQQSQNDPNYQSGNLPGAYLPNSPYVSAYQPQPVQGLNTSPYTGAGYNDPNEARVLQRLAQLNQAMNQPSPLPTQDNKTTNVMGALDGEAVKRLEAMMQQMQSGSTQEDPETRQLNSMLEKVLDIQHPERVQEKIRKTSEARRNQVFAVSSGMKREVISILDKKVTSAIATSDNGFYSLDEDKGSDAQNAIDAVVHETQVIVNGSTVKLRLLDDVYINGKLIPKDNFIYGTASLSGERLVVKVTGVKYLKSLFPVELSVVDIDGMEGIYVPGAIARDVAKASTERAIQDIGFGSMSDNIGIQAAGAGVEAAKSLFSKKVKLIKVTVKAGYRVLLRDEKQKMENQ
ncbi:MAG: conjugative transposon protein TraM [Candidatus Pedobacter colombiensis]|uniref:Conjugative transposon protein TraM n=1 Tax=Candidatus Pedobacter colombiensis TaxID=3121371 RepID=A0AAJ5W691_9SPHI|nr:conjugative transposon protein TraM [Pedobacter sp.]WEK17893.1 MAG: conjugative transposon protein TraM [Pedobacter sp.]